MGVSSSAVPTNSPFSKQSVSRVFIPRAIVFLAAPEDASERENAGISTKFAVTICFWNDRRGEEFQHDRLYTSQ